MKARRDLDRHIQDEGTFSVGLGVRVGAANRSFGTEPRALGRGCFWRQRSRPEQGELGAG